ncbi:MAG TPA: alpha/beta fold hydrolase [Patescibacteria group bacterium]|nr:alpha/beta fold hydrolase [Patescibacteria group bacterium]
MTRPLRRSFAWLLMIGAGIAVVGVAAVYLAPDKVLDAELARKHWQAGVTEKHIEVDGQHWRYLERGPTDGDVVVLLHGLQADSSTWLDVLRHAPDQRRYLIPDLPGFGGSPTPADRDFRAASQAERVHAWLRALDVERIDLAGHSMGGFIAGRFAAAYPSEVRSIGFVDAAGVPFDSNDFLRTLERGENPYKVTTRAQFDRFLDKVFKHRPFLPGPVRDVYADRVIPRADDWNVAMEALKAPDQRYGLVDLLPTLDMPSLVLWCREDQVLDVSSVKVFEAGLPNERVVLLDDCGHMPVMERPRDTADALAALWRSVYAAN